LTSRLCASAEDGQILIDAVAAAEIRHSVPILALGTRRLPRFAEAISGYTVERGDGLFHDVRTERLRIP